VQEQALRVMQDELKAQQERFVAGHHWRAECAPRGGVAANEQPELADAQTRLQNSYLPRERACRCGNEHAQTGAQVRDRGHAPVSAASSGSHECLAYASTSRHELRARQIEVEIEEQQMIIDRSELKPRVEAFTGYEVYSERDPDIGGSFNHGYVIGLNASWHIFDGFATRGRMQATQARREAAQLALQAQQLAVEGEVRSAFFDLQQANRILESETQNVQNASESLEIARGNLGAGLGTQLEVLQAAADVTRVRTTRLSAIYLHNVALARLARATAREPEQLGFTGKPKTLEDAQAQAQAFDVCAPAVGAWDSEMRARRVAAALALGIVCVLNSAQAITLEAALARTAENNPAIQQAKAQLEAAAGRRLVLRSISLPDARIMTPAGVQGGKRAGEDNCPAVRLRTRRFDAAAVQRRHSGIVSPRQHRTPARAAAPQRRRSRATAYRARRLLHGSLSSIRAPPRRATAPASRSKRPHAVRSLPDGHGRARRVERSAATRAGSHAAHRRFASYREWRAAAACANDGR
jgi:outer membrane protein TolC